MKSNVGSCDRVFRIIVGLGILSLTVVGPKSLWGLLGIIPLLTGIFSWCGLYGLLGINTKSCCCSANTDQNKSCSS
jgi:hypothetical protein